MIYIRNAYSHLQNDIKYSLDILENNEYPNYFRRFLKDIKIIRLFK